MADLLTRPAPPIEKRIRWAGILIALGLLVQLITLIWSHPLSFMAFLGIGAPLMIAGALIFLYSLVARPDVGPEPRQQARPQ